MAIEEALSHQLFTAPFPIAVYGDRIHVNNGVFEITDHYC
jgi:hypothetical protein